MNDPYAPPPVRRARPRWVWWALLMLGVVTLGAAAFLYREAVRPHTRAIRFQVFVVEPANGRPIRDALVRIQAGDQLISELRTDAKGMAEIVHECSATGGTFFFSREKVAYPDWQVNVSATGYQAQPPMSLQSVAGMGLPQNADLAAPVRVLIPLSRAANPSSAPSR
jgi:hypothetical protein